MCSILILSDGPVTAHEAASFQTEGRVEVIDNLSRLNWASFGEWQELQYEYLVIRSRIISFFLAPTDGRHAIVCIGFFSSGQFVHSLGCFQVSAFLGQQGNERVHLVARVLRSWGLLEMRVRDTWSTEFVIKPFSLISLCASLDFTPELQASLFKGQGRYRDLRAAFPPLTLDQILRDCDVVSLVGARPYVAGKVAMITGFALTKGYSLVYGRSSDNDKVFANEGKLTQDDTYSGLTSLSPEILHRLAGKYFFGDRLPGHGYSHSISWGFLCDSGAGSSDLLYTGDGNPDIIFCHTGLREKYLLIKYFLTEKYRIQVLWTDEVSDPPPGAAREVWEQFSLLGLFSLDEVFWPTSIPWTLRSLLSFMVRAGHDLRKCNHFCRAVSDGKKIRATRRGISHEGGFVFNLATQFAEVEDAEKEAGAAPIASVPPGFRCWWTNVVEVDFVSHYPEIIIATNASYPGDPDRVIPRFLSELLRMRRALDSNSPKGNAIKLLSNKVYGFISYCFPDLGGEITKSARQVLLSCKKHATGLMDAVVVSADTDGIMVYLPRKSEPGEFCQQLSSLVRADFDFEIPALKAKRAYQILCLGSAKKAYFGLLSTGELIESSTVIGRSDYSAFGKTRLKGLLVSVLELLLETPASEIRETVLEVMRQALADLLRITKSFSMPSCTLAEQESLLRFQKISSKFIASMIRQPFPSAGKPFLMHAMLRSDASCAEMLDRGILASVPLVGFDETLEYAHRVVGESGKSSFDVRAFMEKELIDPANSVFAHLFATANPISFAEVSGTEHQVEIHSENVSLKRKEFDLYNFLNN